MKRNDFDEKAPRIYQELGKQLHLPEDRISAIEEQIRMKVAQRQAEAAAEPVSEPREKKRSGSVGWLAYRAAPLIACLVLAVIGILAVRSGLLKTADTESSEDPESEIVIIEETSVPLTTLTEPPVTGTTVSAVTRRPRTTASGREKETTASTSAATTSATTAATTQTEATTAEHTTVTTYTTARPPETTTASSTTVTTTVTTTTVTTTVTTTTVTTTTVTITAAPKKTGPYLVAADQNVRAGSTVTVRFVFEQDVDFAGIQLSLRCVREDTGEAVEAKVPRFPAKDAIEKQLGGTRTIDGNVLEDFTVVMALAEAKDLSFEAGTVFMEVDFVLPDAPVGTRFGLIDEENCCKMIGRDLDEIAPYSECFSFGKLTVVE